MKKILILLAICGICNAATFSELERRVAQLEEQVAKLTIKVLDKEMAKESPILNVSVDTTNYITGLPSDSTDEVDDDDEYIEVDEETYNLMMKKCIDYCTEEYNKSWHPNVEAAHQCMDDCMRF